MTATIITNKAKQNSATVAKKSNTATPNNYTLTFYA